MKKIIVLAFCMMLLLAACSSSGENETTAAPTSTPSFDTYVGEGTLSTLRSLVIMHAQLEEEVFVKNHLPVDGNAIINFEDATYAPVNGGLVTTFAELRYLVESTYVAEDAAFMLNNDPIYVEIEDKLCFNMAYETRFNGDYAYDWSDFDIRPTDVSDNKIDFEIIVDDYMGNELTVSMSAVSVDGNWRLDK